MEERSLFDDVPASHTSDPASSHQAERQHTASGRRAVHAEIVLKLLRRLPQSTAVELWQSASAAVKKELVEMQEVRRRLCDLKAKGLARQSGCRACRIKGSTMVTWEAVVGDSAV